MLVCKDFNSRLVIAIKRTQYKTTAIVLEDVRRIRSFPNADFDRQYKPTDSDPGKAAATWLASPIKMTQEVRKELQMILEVYKNKVVAKYEAADAPDDLKEGTEQISSAEQLEGKDRKVLVKLYNNACAEKTDHIKGFSDEASLQEVTETVWAKMLTVEPIVKQKAAPKEKAERASGPRKNKIYAFVKDAEKLPPQAKQILDIIKAAGTISRLDLLAKMEGVVVTRQTLDRILGFYEPKLKEFVVITEETPTEG